MSKEKNCECVQRTAQCKINNECKLNKLKMHIAFEWWKRNVYRWTWAASRQWHSLSTFHLDARFIFPFSFYHLFLYESCEAFMCSGLVTSCEYERKKNNNSNNSNNSIEETKSWDTNLFSCISTMESYMFNVLSGMTRHAETYASHMFSRKIHSERNATVNTNATEEQHRRERKKAVHLCSVISWASAT